MARRKIIWSHHAQIKLYGILEFYIERNKSKIYSEKLYKTIYKEIKILLKQPDIGLKTDFENIRCLIVSDYMIYYESVNEGIIIHSVWDCRQNPDDIFIK